MIVPEFDPEHTESEADDGIIQIDMDEFVMAVRVVATATPVDGMPPHYHRLLTSLRTAVEVYDLEEEKINECE